MRSVIKFYRSYWEAAAMLTDPEERCKYYDMIFSYAFEDAEPELGGTAGAMFVLTKPTIDAYLKRSDAGAEGGRSKGEANRKQTASKSKASVKQTASKSEANGNDSSSYVNEDVNVYVNDNDKRKTIKRFTPPTAEEVRSYCLERGNGVDADHFVDYYTSKGWKVGNQPMKDWKAAVRTWERNGYSKPQTVQTTSSFEYGESELAAIRALKRRATT